MTVVKWAKFEPGALAGWTKKLAQGKRRDILEKLVKKESYATVIRKLLQLKNVTKDEETVKKATSDMEYLQKKFRNAPHKKKSC